jgi:glycosyltransferase involved in cell wall biosynthesis
LPEGKKILFVVNVDWFFLSHRLPIALAAKEAGYDVSVIAADTGAGKKITAKGLRFIEFPELEKKQAFFSELKMIFHLKDLYKQLQPDIIHHVTIRPVLYGSIAARFAKIFGVVNALSGLGYIYMNNTNKHRLIRMLLDIIFKTGFKHPNLKLILQNNDDIELILNRKLIEPKKIVLIKGSGVNTNKYRPTSKKEGQIKIALIGRMLRDKGVEEYIEAAKIIVNKYIDVSVEFHLYGAPYESNPTSIPESEIKRWKTYSWLYYHGHCENIADELNDIDIVCLPSYREGLPKSLLEAASAGKPIVTTDVPGCREIVEHGVNGYLVPPKNVEKLAGSIQKLIENSELRKDFGIKSREKVVKEFAVEKIIKQTLDLYEEILQ